MVGHLKFRILRWDGKFSPFIGLFWITNIALDERCDKASQIHYIFINICIILMLKSNYTVDNKPLSLFHNLTTCLLARGNLTASILVSKTSYRVFIFESHFITRILCYSSYFRLTKTNYLCFCFSLAFGGLCLLQSYQNKCWNHIAPFSRLYLVKLKVVVQLKSQQ